ncbi:MAG: GHKL domain-containing protein, partial [Chloroflexi bacterium]|nr:GHKL domain-containing protein [Chloroflexota bacterium]
CVSVNAVVESALQLRDSELRRNRVEVELVLEPDLPDVLVDPQQLQQVFLNLIDNAVQAMAESHTGGRLTVGTSRVDHHLRITFTDDGPGIPSKLRDQVFESFFTTAEDSQRLGLGLAICRRLLRSHGGSIRAEDSDGCGAILVIELPILSA